MNERMLELELEATAYADSKVPANDRYNDIYHSIVRGKFAELIVRECMSKTAGYLLEDEFGGPDVKEASEELAKLEQLRKANTDA